MPHPSPQHPLHLARAHSGEPLMLHAPDRLRHLYVVGQTGTGKTTLLRNLILQDLHLGHGVGLIDPHGDLAEELLDHYPPSRADDLIYLDPADPDWSVGLDLLGLTPPLPHARELTASSIVSAFKGVWRDSWGPRMEYILWASVATLLCRGGLTLLSLPRLLSDPRYRAWVVQGVDDPVLHGFWEREFDSWDKRLQAEAVSPILNKAGQLLMSRPLRHMLGQKRTRFSPRWVMDSGRVFIANLSKGRMGEDKAALLGAFLVTAFQLAAMSRADTPQESRVPFHLVVDEFQNASTDAFASILSESRKYGLSLTLAHQYLAQVPEPVLDAVFGNVGSLVAFRCGERDAQALERSIGHYPARHLADLSNHEAVFKLLDDGEPRQPVTGRTYPPHTSPNGGRKPRLKDLCRQRYATPRPVIEEKLTRWLQQR